MARVPNDLRDPRVLRDTKVSARSIKDFSPLPFIAINCYLSVNLPSAKQKSGTGSIPMPELVLRYFLEKIRNYRFTPTL